MKKTGKRIGIIFAVIIGIVLAAVLALLTVLTVTEYKPADVEKVSGFGRAKKEIKTGDSIDVISWNIGYGALGDNADFFMDGGTKVKPSTKERVEENIGAVTDFLSEEAADIVLLQEVDENSTHSYYLNERSMIMQGLEDAGLSYENRLAYNYKTLFVPYPIPPIGREQSGVATFSAYPASDAERISLPCPFSYPIRLANLKRCLLVNRIPVSDSNKELVVINLHLEAYDDGEGKEAQTRMLAQLLHEEAAKGNYVIAGGDFNQTFDTVDRSDYPMQGETLWQPGVIDTDEFAGMQCLMDERVPSCRSLDRAYHADDPTFQYYMLDGYLLSDNLTVETFETVDLGFVNSDHNPVRLRVTVE